MRPALPSFGAKLWALCIECAGLMGVGALIASAGILTLAAVLSIGR